MADAIEQAVIETNREIAAEAWDQEHVELDHTGDRTPETVGDGLEGQIEDEEAEETQTEEVEAEAAETPEGEEQPAADAPKPGEEQPAPKPEGRVPSGVHRQALDKVRALEAERDNIKSQFETSTTNSRAEVKALSDRLDGVLAVLRQQQQPPVQPKTEAETVPDMFEDPKGFADFLQKGFQRELSARDQRFENLRVETSMQMAHSIHKEAFEKSIAALQQLNPQSPDDRVTVQRIYNAPNPGQALVDWHKRNETLREVGNDPAKYREKVEADARAKLMADPEFRKQLIETLQAEANGGNGGKPNTITRLPKSLNGAPGGSRPGIASEDFDGSSQAVADSAWR